MLTLPSKKLRIKILSLVYEIDAKNLRPSFKSESGSIEL
jgi:hypothetical protein